MTCAQTIRARHTKHFTVLSNQTIRDERLSPKAKAILIDLLSRPDGWRVIPKFVAQVMGMGVNTVKKYLRELEQYGYLIRERQRDSLGRFTESYHTIVEYPTRPDSDPDSSSFLPTVRKSSTGKATVQKLASIRSIEDTNTKSNEFLNHSPLTPPSYQWEEERDPWDLNLDPEQTAAYKQVQLKCENPKIETGNIDPVHAQTNDNLTPNTEDCSKGEYSAADYKKTSKDNQVTEVQQQENDSTPGWGRTKVTRAERREMRRQETWVEFGRANGLWESMSELQGFMSSLYAYAINNPRLHTPSKWVESEVEKTVQRGTGTHWVEYQAGLQVGTIDRKPWADVYGNVNPSFRSYIEQTKYGESGNSTARAVELAAQVLADPFKAGLMWNEYQRRLERELEEKAKYERLGITYDPPSILKPKQTPTAEHTAKVQQVLGLDAAATVYQPVLIAKTVEPTTLATSEVETPYSAVSDSVALPNADENIDDGAEAPWDLIAAQTEAMMTAEMERMMGVEESEVETAPASGETVNTLDAVPSEVELQRQIAALTAKMDISQPPPQVTPLSEIYADPKPVNPTEAREFREWYDAAKAKGLVSYSYSDPKHLAVVVLADDETALPWREARALFQRGGQLD